MGSTVSCVVDMYLRDEFEIGNYRGIDVNHLQRGMIGHQVAAAEPAELTMVHIGLSYVAIFSAPFVIATPSGGESVNALTGPADQDRHDRQWQ